MDCDLHHIIGSKQPLTEQHFKCFARQILEGVKAMHSVGVYRKYRFVRMLEAIPSRLHCNAIYIVIDRDLKPGNLLLSKDCQLRITDFGLARFMDEETIKGLYCFRIFLGLSIHNVFIIIS
jgi:serine/threonine protein kinase